MKQLVHLYIVWKNTSKHPSVIIFEANLPGFLLKRMCLELRQFQSANRNRSSGFFFAAFNVEALLTVRFLKIRGGEKTHGTSVWPAGNVPCLMVKVDGVFFNGFNGIEMAKQ